MNTPRLLITEPKDYAQEALDLLCPKFDLDFGPLTRAELKNKIGCYDGVLVRLGHKFDRELLTSATKLKFIASPTTGLNHVDIKTTEENNIAVLSLKGEVEFLNNIYATAEHCWGLLLSLLRHIPKAHNSVSQGNWNRDEFKAYELHDKTLGIIGCGRLGRKIAGYANAFGMTVIAYDPFVNDVENVEFVDSLNALAERADVVIVHCSYSDQTHHLLDADFFNAMKRHALFINTARGEIIDEQALFDALENKKIAGVALDVLAGENSLSKQDFSDYLKEKTKAFNNLIITPHVGGATYESMAKTEIFIAQKICKFFDETDFAT